MTFVPPETLHNLSDVRELDLSYNELPGPPNSAWQSMHHLRTLSLAGNPITTVMNDSFVGLERLETLDISRIRADNFSVGFLTYFIYLCCCFKLSVGILTYRCYLVCFLSHQYAFRAIGMLSNFIGMLSSFIFMLSNCIGMRSNFIDMFSNFLGYSFFSLKQFLLGLTKRVKY